MIFSLFACSKDSNSTNQTKQAIQDLLVKDNEITGWSFRSSGWTANNVSELTTYIDGAAELYQKYGFVEASDQKYTGKVNNTSADMEIYVFNLGTKENVLGCYSDANNGLSGAITMTLPIGEGSKYVRNGGLSQVMAFIKGKYYVYLDISADTEESLNVLTQFAKNINAKIKS